MSQCIGKRGGVPCSNVSPDDPPYPEHPTWPYLCSGCANEPPHAGSRNTRGIVEQRPVTEADFRHQKSLTQEQSVVL